MEPEYYIRNADQETARGPYNIDQLNTLAEAGQLERESLYFDDTMKAWVTIASNEVLVEKVFPDKKRLILRKKDAPVESSPEDNARPAVQIHELLAAAEGNTKETRYIREMVKWRERAASLAVPVIAGLLLLSAASMIYPSWDIINTLINDPEASYFSLLQKPIVLLGGLDLIMGILVLLNALEVFPLIRFRAMVGSGFFATIYFAQYINGNPDGLWLGCAILAFGGSLFTCTLTQNFRIMVAAAVTGGAGILGLVWFANIVPMFFSAT